MKRSMCPIEKEVFNEVNNQYLSEYFPKTREILKP